MKSPVAKFLALSLGLAVAGITQPAFATDATWANSTELTGTFTSAGTGGLYTYSGTLAVGDAIQATAGTAGLTSGALYYVTAISSGTYTLSATPGGAAITGVAAGTPVGVNGVYSWNATAASGVQNGASWTGSVVPNGTDATATIGNFSNNSGNNAGIAIQQNITIGTLNVTETSKQWSLVSSNLGTSTTLSTLTFATTGATPAGPTINTSASNQLARLGFHDASFSGGTLKISGTQGLTLILGSAGMRIETVDWSGFTDGAAGKGTITLQQGLATNTNQGNVFGTGTNSLNVTIGNGSSPSGATAPELNLGGGLTVNNLNGTANGRVSGAQTLTIGAGNGTNTDFLGIIGQTAAGVNSNTNLLMTGSGTQTISGQIVGASATVTVNGAGGALVLNGSNSFGGATTVTAGTLRVTNTNALGATTGVSIGAAGTLDIRSDSSATFLGTGGNAVAVTGTASGATINVNQATGAGTGQTITIGTFTVGSTAATAQTVFTGTNNTSLSTGAVTDATASGGTVQITNNIASTGTLTLASFADTRTGAPTLQFDGSGNTTVTGAITQTGTTALTYAGSGTLTLGGSNTYTGVTTVNAGGTLSVSSLANGGTVSNIGASSNAASNFIFNGGTLSYTGTSVTIDRGFTYSSGNGGTIAVTNVATNLNITGLAAQSSVGASSLTKTGPGTLTLSGTGDTSSFGLIVNAGEVDFNDSGAPGSGRVITRNGAIINGGGIVKITGTNGDQIQNTQVVTVNNGTFNMNGKSETAGNLTIGDGINNGVISGGSGSTYTNGNGATGTFNAESGSVDVRLAGGGTVLNKTTSGTVMLSQANTYTGATNVTGGTLVVSGSISGTASVGLGSSTLEVDGSLNSAATISATNGTLQGTGIVGAISLTSTSTLAPGLSSSSFVAGAALRAGNVTFSDTGSALSLGLGIVTGSDSTQLASTGTVTLNNTPLQLTLGSALNNSSNIGLAYIILNGGAGATGAGSDVFSYNGVALANTNTFTTPGGFTFEVIYGGAGVGTNDIGNANDDELVLTAIPEPGTWVMMLAGIGILAVWPAKHRSQAR